MTSDKKWEMCKCGEYQFPLFTLAVKGPPPSEGGEN